MKGLLEEIREIPERAEECYQRNRKIHLPLQVPYCGMGASYFAPLALTYCRKDIIAHIASEYYYYEARSRNKHGVLISQSGETSEVLWCSELFDQVTAITNNRNSSLARSKKNTTVIDIAAGKEESFSSTKTYFNTLLVLYLGLGLDPKPGIEVVKKKFTAYQSSAEKMASKIYSHRRQQPVNGLFILGNGPNVGTAHEGALTLSETNKFSWLGMPVAQYDHGYKETANNSVVIILNGGGKESKRIAALNKVLAKTSALVIELKEAKIAPQLTPLPFVVQLNLLMYQLARLLKTDKTFSIGSKVTQVDDSYR